MFGGEERGGEIRSLLLFFILIFYDRNLILKLGLESLYNAAVRGCGLIRRAFIIAG